MKTYAEIKQEVDARSAEDWFYVLDNVEKCADREHTVVHLTFSSCWIFSTGQNCRWCMDPAPRAIRDQEVKEAPPVDVPILIREVRRVGYNIDQVLKIARAQDLVDVPQLRKALEENRALVKQITNVYAMAED